MVKLVDPQRRIASSLPALLLAVAVLPGCEYFDKKATTPTPGAAVLDIAVTPDPLRVLWVCPPSDTNCYGSLDSTVTVTETAGVGGRVDSVEFVVRDSVLGVELTKLQLTTADIKAKAGTERIEPMGRLAVRPIIEGYPVPSRLPRPTIVIDINVQVTDDKANVVRQSKRVPVT